MSSDFVEGSSAPSAARGQNNPNPNANAHLAVTHRFTLRVPSAETAAIQRRHLDQCAKLNCTVLTSSIDRQNEGRTNGRVTVRINPEGYNILAALLAIPPAEIASHTQSAEDLATPVFDAERRLAVKVALRDRLTAMLNDASMKTAADLITIEKELAQAQGDIETMTAQRDQLRTRTDSVRVEIYYSGVAARIGGIDLSPIHQAVRGVGQTFVGSIAWLISFVVAVVPWLPLAALLIWGVRRTLRRWRAKKTQPQTWWPTPPRSGA